jgi:hypothetical protein
VTARARQTSADTKVWAPTSLLSWQPRFTESRTPTGTEPSAPQKVRMEAGRIGGDRSSSRRGHATSGTSQLDMAKNGVNEMAERSEGRVRRGTVLGPRTPGRAVGALPQTPPGGKPPETPGPLSLELGLYGAAEIGQGFAPPAGAAALDQSPPLRRVRYEEGKGASIDGAVVEPPVGRRQERSEGRSRRGTVPGPRTQSVRSGRCPKPRQGASPLRPPDCT